MTSDPIGPLERLRDDLRAVRLELEVPGHGRGAARSGRPGRPGGRLRPAATAPAGRACVDRRRRLDRRGQVDARQQPRRRGRQPGRRAPPDDPRARCSPATRTTCAGSRTTVSCPGCARVTGGAARPARSSSFPRRRCQQGLALLDSPDIDSVLAENRALAQPAPRRGRRLALRHDRGPLRRRRAVGVPALGARARDGALDRAQPGAGGRRPGGRRRTCGRCWKTEQLGDSRRPRRPRGLARGRPPAGRRALARARLARRARGGRAGAGGARASDAARRAREPSRPGRGRRARARSSSWLRPRSSAAEADARLRGRAARGREPPCGAGRCCAARCLRAGTRSSGRAT